jgi:hypothetical protein
VADPRDRRGCRWALEILLRVVVVSIAAGAKSLVCRPDLSAAS